MTNDPAELPVTVEPRFDGALWHVWLDRPKANILDAAMLNSLTDLWQRAAEEPRLKAVLMEGRGPSFSFGASVEEHLPETVEEMLHTFHGLFRTMMKASVPALAAVRGQCLGGGLEVVTFCHRIFASPDAKLGQPEMQLGVLAPVASLLLEGRIGRPATEDLCITGRVVDAEEARAMGLVDEVTEDPTAAAIAWVETHLLPKSAASIRYATQAVRRPMVRLLGEDLDAVERIYLEGLMSTADAVEGIRAFLEKRKPEWTDS